MNNTERIAEIRAWSNAATIMKREVLDEHKFVTKAMERIPYLLSEIDRLTQSMKDIGKECARRHDEIQRLTAELEQKTRELKRYKKVVDALPDMSFVSPPGILEDKIKYALHMHPEAFEEAQIAKVALDLEAEDALREFKDFG